MGCWLSWSVGCEGTPTRPEPAPPTASATPTAGPGETAPAGKPTQARPTATPIEVPEVATRYEPVPKLAAIGDVHGDVDAARRALQLAGAIDASDQWVGGALVVVQTGDQLDRGDEEKQILDLFDRVAEQASAAGGAFIVLNGNHEYMNAMGDFRYVTPGGLAAFADEAATPEAGGFPANAQGRAAAFLPAGRYARRLAERNAVAIVGDTVFAHGGVLPKYARDVDRINALGRKWLAGALEDPSEAVSLLMAPDSVVWTRAYSDGEPTPQACGELSEALRLMSASRMVVGHTIQKEGITSACDGKVWRIDTGMAEHYGGRPSALLIEGADVRPVYAPTP